MRKAILPFVMLLSAAANAAERAPDSYKVASATNVGQGNFSEALSLSGSHPTEPGDDAGEVDWSGSYTFSRTPVGSGSNKTHAFDLGLGYRKDVDVGAGFSFSRTPEENLRSAGPSLWAGYLFKLGSAGEDKFRPGLEPKLYFKDQSYTQTFGSTRSVRSGSRRSVARPSTGSESIRQDEFSLSLEASVFEALTVTLSGSSYKYDKNVSRFLGLLDSPRAVNSGAASFADTLGGFPKSSADLSASITPWDTWEIDAGVSRTKLESDGSSSTGAKLEVEKDLTDSVKAGLGFDHERSQTQGEENLTLVDLAYKF